MDSGGQTPTMHPFQGSDTKQPADVMMRFRDKVLGEWRGNFGQKNLATEEYLSVVESNIERVLTKCYALSHALFCLLLLWSYEADLIKISLSSSVKWG